MTKTKKTKKMTARSKKNCRLSPNANCGENLRQLRRGAHFTQCEMALLAGVSQATVNNWEHGRVHPTKEKFGELIAVFEDYYRQEISPASVVASEVVVMGGRVYTANDALAA